MSCGTKSRQALRPERRHLGCALYTIHWVICSRRLVGIAAIVNRRTPSKNDTCELVFQWIRQGPSTHMLHHKKKHCCRGHSVAYSVRGRTLQGGREGAPCVSVPRTASSNPGRYRASSVRSRKRYRRNSEPLWELRCHMEASICKGRWRSNARILDSERNQPLPESTCALSAFFSQRTYVLNVEDDETSPDDFPPLQATLDSQETWHREGAEFEIEKVEVSVLDNREQRELEFKTTPFIFRFF